MHHDVLIVAEGRGRGCVGEVCLNKADTVFLESLTGCGIASCPGDLVASAVELSGERAA